MPDKYRKWDVSHSFSRAAAEGALTYTRPLVRLQGVPGMTPAYWAVVRVLAGVLAAPVAMVAGHCESHAATNIKKKKKRSVQHWRCVCVWVGGCKLAGVQGGVSFMPASTYRCSLSGSWPAQTLDGTRRPRPPWVSPCRCGRSRALYSYSWGPLGQRKGQEVQQWSSPTVTDRLHTKGTHA